MNYKKCKHLIKEDYQAIPVKRMNKLETFITSDSFKISYWFRIGSYLQSKKSIGAKIAYLFVQLIYKHYEHLAGVWIPLGTNISGGVFFTHTNGIVIAGGATVKKNVWIFQGVTIGAAYGKGNPIIDENAILFAGAKVIGNVKVGKNAIVGANAVVVKDVPDNAVVVGVPAVIKSYDGERIANEYRSNK